MFQIKQIILLIGEKLYIVERDNKASQFDICNERITIQRETIIYLISTECNLVQCELECLLI